MDISTIEPYSARKNSTNGIALCSVMKPETSSDSASTRSKGVRFSSARIAGKASTKIGSSGITNHTDPCDSITVVRLNEPDTNTTQSTAEDRISSYESICDTDRIDPRKL